MSNRKQHEVVEIDSDNEQPSGVGSVGQHQQEEKGESVTAQSAHQELPFLVTHWLANFRSNMNNATDEGVKGKGDQSKNKEALERINRATSELASAFSDLGAFGSASRPRFNHGRLHPGHSTSATERNASFADVARKWHSLQSDHLETVLGATATTTVAFQEAASRDAPSVCLLDKAYEEVAEQPPAATVTSHGSVGRMLRETKGDETVVPSAASILQQPTLVATSESTTTVTPAMAKSTSIESSKSMNSKTSVIPHQQLAVPVESDYRRVAQESGRSMQKCLYLREKCREEEQEIRTLKQSIWTNKVKKENVIAEREEFLKKTQANSQITNSGEPGSPSGKTRSAVEEAKAQTLSKIDEFSSKEEGCDRVIVQLQRRLLGLSDTHKQRVKDASSAFSSAKQSFQKTAVLSSKYRDPFQMNAMSSPPVPLSIHGSGKSNRVLLDITRRAFGGGSFRQSSVPAHRRITGRKPSLLSTSLTRKSVLSRLSHATTVSTHLSYPVYCGCFDKTGRYFVTGADDFLVKVFYLGPAKSCTFQPRDEEDRRKINYGANARGAVLVCTLRGHAGVICDICVNEDNALLATASDDGDCRVWGLRDGCPVAILRGHKGGANMVSWSKLSPYRLVSIGTDGLARIWDVRKAALKRYGAQVGKRLDYTLPLTNSERRSMEQATEEVVHETQTELDSTMAPTLPPLPQREMDAQIPAPVVANANQDAPTAPNAIIVPPLPPGVAPLEGAGGANGNNRQEGSFIANDNIDEGVQLIAKLQHGDLLDVSAQGPSTRGRQKAIKVVCVARCPLGGHFATGSDDGLGRIWADEEEDRLEKIDQRFFDPSNVRKNTQTNTFRKGTRKSARMNPCSQFGSADVASTSRLLASLAGHVNAITDIHYSNNGDRLLTASQRDGLIRVWSWGSESASSEHAAVSSVSTTDIKGEKFSDLKHILIRLRNPSSSGSAQSSRRRGGNSSSSRASNPFCDVAVWTSDDSKIVTSQCCLVQENSQEIVGGSQYLLVWDSRTGQCLLGIASAHTMSCPVLLPHPLDASILCSAAGDGRVSLWDLDSGERLLTHENKVNHGLVEPPSDRGKKSGYLDGSFSPDGLRLILTDDKGRFTVFDSLVSCKDCTDFGGSVRDERTSVPLWMREQYFANDYYDLLFDENGYCIESGSRQPPHMAPRGVRCNHSGVPFPEAINDAFHSIIGPVPLSEQEVRHKREAIRSNGLRVRRPGGLLMQNVRDKRVMIVGEFDPDKTIVIGGNGGEISGPVNFTHEPINSGVVSRQLQPSGVLNESRNGANNHGRRNITSSGNALSSNWEYLDYNDLVRREGEIGEDPDSDDEEFEEPAQRSAYASSDDDLDSFDSMDDAEGDSSPRRSRSRSSGRRSGRQNGGSSRSRRIDRRRRDRREESRSQNRSQIQPTRVSARQQERDSGTYFDVGSDDEDLEEQVLSTNNTPSGPHAGDYRVHFFRLPDSNSHLKREWLRRIESVTSYNGRKTYAPQVGDSVVYIPRAHYETISAYPLLENPWKKWSRDAAWPVVRCCVKDLRYRFPYEVYYRSRDRNERCSSVVVILTLEVTGIPEISHERWFPWPKPYFVDRQTRSSGPTFEVPIFENDCPSYIFPESLYLWRLESLEEAIESHEYDPRGIPILTYFTPEDGLEDVEYEGYNAKLLAKSTKEDRTHDIHFKGAGYESFEAVWDDGSDEVIPVSPWELDVQNGAYDVPEPPRMNDEVKRAVTIAIQKIEDQPGIQEWFSSPVNVKRYCDYLNRIEVSMDFSIIRKRLVGDYYSNKLSVLSDVRLIRDNCFKYNGPSDLARTADEMYDDFATEIEKIEEPPVSPTRPRRPDRAPSSRNRAGRSSVLDRDQRPPSPTYQRRSPRSTRARSSSGTHRSERHLSSDFEAASALERLPAPNPVGRRFTSSATDAPNRSASMPSTRSRNATTDGTENSVLERATRTRRRPTSYDGNSSEEDVANGGQPTRSRRVISNTLPGPRTSRRTRSRDVQGSHNDEASSSEDDVEGREGRGDRQIQISARDTRRSIRSGNRPMHVERAPSEESPSEESPSEESEGESEEESEGEVNHGLTLRQRTRVTSTTATRTQKNRTLYEDQDSSPAEDDADEEKLSSFDGDSSVLDSEASDQEAGDDESEASFEEESSEEEVVSPTRRSSRQRAAPKQNMDVESSTTRRTARKSQVRKRAGDDESEASFEEESSEEEVVSPTRRSSRQRAAPKQNMGVESSTTRRSARKSQVRKRASPRQVESPSTRTSSRLRSHPTYEDVDRSDIDFDGEEASESEESEMSSSSAELVPQRKKRKAPIKRKAKPVSRKPQKRVKKESPKNDLPDLPEWPEIDIKSLSGVAKAVMTRMEELDEDGIFYAPVLETYPEIKDAYTRVVKEPLDFRTILEEHIPAYESIIDLQLDLILVFNNCIMYNGPGTVLSNYSISLWEQINDVFKDVCNEEGVMLPRRW